MDKQTMRLVLFGIGLLILAGIYMGCYSSFIRDLVLLSLGYFMGGTFCLLAIGSSSNKKKKTVEEKFGD